MSSSAAADVDATERFTCKYCKRTVEFPGCASCDPAWQARFRLWWCEKKTTICSKCVAKLGMWATCREIHEKLAKDKRVCEECRSLAIENGQVPADVHEALNYEYTGGPATEEVDRV